MPSKMSVAALALPALAAAFPKPSLFTRDTSSIQIVGGEDAAAGDFPFIVSLSEDGSHFCGGTLVGPTTVVTAAHCSVDQDPAAAKVRAGSLKWKSGGTQVGVASIKVHPDYDENTVDNDVAVWTLSDAIEEGDNISYVTLTESGSDPEAGSEVTVAGWGTEESGSSQLPDNLMKVTVPVTDRATCKEEYGSQNEITDNMICAGLEEGGKDACQGDSGGPLVDDSGALVGIVSWGNGCAQAGYSGVYTHVGNFVDFIKDNTA